MVVALGLNNQTRKESLSIFSSLGMLGGNVSLHGELVELNAGFQLVESVLVAIVPELSENFLRLRPRTWTVGGLCPPLQHGGEPSCSRFQMILVLGVKFTLSRQEFLGTVHPPRLGVGQHDGPVSLGIGLQGRIKL